MKDSPFRLLDTPVSASTALEALPPALSIWFRRRFGEPTAAQRLAWPAVADGHLLVSAPTGTGKTLAALLPILADLFRYRDPAGWSDSPLRALYIAPLKALVNDAARTLESHLTDLAELFPDDTRLPRLGVRTGDTPAEERRRQQEEPPDLLLTTPESLAVLLSQASYTPVLANLAWVVVDEVHALAGNKRGADLAASLERLEALSCAGGLRRIGLSATAAPLAEAARYLVGPGRSCTIACVKERSGLSLSLEPLPEGNRFFGALVDRLERELPCQRATLVFTNSRALAERLAWTLRRRMPDWDRLIGVHHSALSAPRRREVEQPLQGRRAAGRRVEHQSGAGHRRRQRRSGRAGPSARRRGAVASARRPGRTRTRRVRRGLVLTASPAELLEAAVTLASGRSGQCEPLRLPPAPLDVLCQQILGMCCARSHDAEEMFDGLRRSAPYAELRREDFNDCLAYLRGIDREGEAWLPARLRADGDCWRIRNVRTARLFRRNLGTILAERSAPVVLRTPNADARLRRRCRS